MYSIRFKNILLALMLLLAARASAAQHVPGQFNVKVGFVSDSGIVLFYKGFDAGLTAGEEFNLYSETGWLARILVQKNESNFTSAKIVDGNIHSEYTGKYLAALSTKPQPEPSPVRAAAEEKPITIAEPDEKPEPPAEKKPKPAPKKPPESKQVVEQPEQDQWEQAAAPPPKQPNRVSYSMIVRFDSHSSVDYPDANIATIVSATRKARTSLTTMYLIGNTDVSNRIPDYVGAGLNFTSFLTPLFNYSFGYIYQARDYLSSDPDFKTRTDLVTFSASKTMLPKTYRNTALTTSFNLSAKPNFRDNRSYSGTVQLSKKFLGDMRFAVSYKRLWQFASVGYRQSLDQYGADFSLKIRDKRYTFGYYYLDRNNIFNRTSIDDDRNFRFTIYSAGK